MSVYNAGCDGQGISYANAVLKAICSRKKPKMVILECSDTELLPTWLDKMSVLKPYYPDYPQMLDVAVLAGGANEKYKSLCASYRFNSTIFRIVKTYMMHNDALRGYEPSSKKSAKQLVYIQEEEGKFEISEEVMTVLNDFVKSCKEEGIRLIVCNSPILRNSSTIANNLKNTFIGMGVKYFDYSNDTTFINHPSMFFDYVHLNSDGADLFTKMVARDINNIQ